MSDNKQSEIVRIDLTTEQKEKVKTATDQNENGRVPVSSPGPADSWSLQSA